MLKLLLLTSLFALVCGNIFINPKFYFKEGICNINETIGHYCYIYLPENYKCLNLYSDYDKDCINFKHKDKIKCWYNNRENNCILFDNKTKLLNYLNNEIDSFNYISAIILFFIFVILIYHGITKLKKN